jgi:ATP-dependent RNA helicase DeaD
MTRPRFEDRHHRMPSSRSSSTNGFAALGLAEGLVTVVTALGYEEPTPVQRETIPLMLSGRDLLAQAATGTGKTAAFTLPMLQTLLGPGPADRPKPEGAARKRGSAPTCGMVLVPTRELAMQVAEAVHRYARGTGITVVPLYGGASMQQQIRALDRGADVVVATPGRALDHLRRQTLVLESLRVLVLDEADEMLDMGFAEDIDAILETTPETRQTVLFSATMPARILSIAKRHLNNAERVTVAREKTAAGKLPRIRQVAYIVRRAQKPAALDRILDMENPTSALVFCRTRLEVDSLVETLNAHGYRAEALHGGMQQRQRDAVMNRVRTQKTDLLIATDVAARGLDIEHLSHVVNYDVPNAPEAYVHRIGRTGRAGREGTAITLAEPREHRLLRSIEQLTKQKIDVATVPTVADLRARRLELTRVTLREQLVAGDFDDVRVVVESLAEEFDVLDVAAAAVKMAHLATAGDGEKNDFDLADLPPPRGASAWVAGGREERDAGTARPNRERSATGKERRAAPAGNVVRLWIGAGRTAGVRPGDLVGAITGEAGIPARAIGAIEITERFSLVEVPDELADTIVDAMSKASLRGQRVSVRRDRS